MDVQARELVGLPSLSAPVEELELKAINGSGSAAMELAHYYEIAEINPPKEEYWAQVAAENGDTDGEYTLGFVLTERSEPLVHQRGCYWIKRAAAHGQKLAQSLFRERCTRP